MAIVGFDTAGSRRTSGLSSIAYATNGLHLKQTVSWPGFFQKSHFDEGSANVDDQALRDFFKFDDADLFANRSGRLSDKQQKALTMRDQKYRKVGIGCGILSLVAALVLIVIIFVRGWIGSSILEELGALVWAGVGGYLLYLQFFKPASTKNVLKKVVGPTRIVAVERQSGNHTGSYTGYELHCGDEKFELDEIPAHLLIQGDIYAVYFIVVVDKDDDAAAGIPWVKEILSMEWLSKGP